MVSSKLRAQSRVIVDSIHGDIHVSDRECRVIDTLSFQRLRRLKQLGMAHLTYPNATHTRFAHSIGVLGVMEKVVQVARDPLNLTKEQQTNIRLAGLLHDVGHYPYSHLMESLDKVQLTEEFVKPKKEFDAGFSKYPNHEELGELIVTHQSDLMDAIGGKEAANRIARLFRGKAIEEQQIAKLIHSSLDMDRLDYLLRDAHATGVPYGRVDLNYLLNSLRISPSGLLGVEEKALAAAEHSLFARFFMHRTVYFHKTTFGLEEACRHVLRRLRDEDISGLPKNGDAVRSLVKSTSLLRFTDSLVDQILEQGAKWKPRSGAPKAKVIRVLSNSILARKPPKLLKEICVFEDAKNKHHAGTAFKKTCRHELAGLAKKYRIPLGLFLFAETKPLTLEQRGGLLTTAQARDLQPEEQEELIRVFRRDGIEPVSIVEIDHSVVRHCSNHFHQSFRLYVVDEDDGKIEKLRAAVADWDQS